MGSPQVMAVPAIVAGHNVVLADETGSGKTLAYLAPLITQLLANGPPAEPVADTYGIDSLAVLYALCHDSRFERLLFCYAGSSDQAVERSCCAQMRHCVSR